MTEYMQCVSNMTDIGYAKFSVSISVDGALLIRRIVLGWRGRK